MATLNLVRFDNGNLGLQAIGQPSRNADFSLYDLDGEGGDPFAFGGAEWTLVAGVAPQEFYADESDTFWVAQQAILDACRAAGISLPDYV